MELLPVELFLQIGRELEPPEIWSLRAVCSQFRERVDYHILRCSWWRPFILHFLWHRCSDLATVTHYQQLLQLQPVELTRDGLIWLHACQAGSIDLVLWYLDELVPSIRAFADYFQAGLRLIAGNNDRLLLHTVLWVRDLWAFHDSKQLQEDALRRGAADVFLYLARRSGLAMPQHAVFDIWASQSREQCAKLLFGLFQQEPFPADGLGFLLRHWIGYGQAGKQKEANSEVKRRYWLLSTTMVTGKWSMQGILERELASRACKLGDLQLLRVLQKNGRLPLSPVECYNLGTQHGQKEVATWAREQPSWLRDLLRRRVALSPLQHVSRGHVQMVKPWRQYRCPPEELLWAALESGREDVYHALQLPPDLRVDLGVVPNRNRLLNLLKAAVKILDGCVVMLQNHFTGWLRFCSFWHYLRFVALSRKHPPPPRLVRFLLSVAQQHVDSNKVSYHDLLQLHADPIADEIRPLRSVFVLRNLPDCFFEDHHQKLLELLPKCDSQQVATAMLRRLSLTPAQQWQLCLHSGRYRHVYRAWFKQ
jgi:hypothetical protein